MNLGNHFASTAMVAVEDLHTAAGQAGTVDYRTKIDIVLSDWIHLEREI